jgi:DtxR family manganese transport transcriptional regulator
MKRTSPKPIAVARIQHAGENTADYLETIADLLAEKGEARLVDLAARLGVSKATATKTVQRIQRAGHIRTEPYRAIFLSESGAALASEAKRRHTIVLEFLRAGGVPEAIAQQDAEGLEHHASEETLALLKRLTVKLRAPGGGSAR